MIEYEERETGRIRMTRDKPFSLHGFNHCGSYSGGRTAINSVNDHAYAMYSLTTTLPNRKMIVQRGTSLLRGIANVHYLVVMGIIRC